MSVLSRKWRERQLSPCCRLKTAVLQPSRRSRPRRGARRVRRQCCRPMLPNPCRLRSPSVLPSQNCHPAANPVLPSQASCPLVRRQCCRPLLPKLGRLKSPSMLPSPSMCPGVQESGAAAPAACPAPHPGGPPQRGKPIGRPAAGRRCWSAVVAACGRGLQPATSRRRPGAGTRTGVPGRRKRWPPPGGSHRERCNGGRRRCRCGPLPYRRRGGRHPQLQ